MPPCGGVPYSSASRKKPNRSRASSALMLSSEKIRLCSAEKIALGSDYPFPLGEHAPGKLIESMTDLSTSTRDRLLHGTALEFLGLEREQYVAVDAVAGVRTS